MVTERIQSYRDLEAWRLANYLTDVLYDLEHRTLLADGAT